MPGPWNPRRGRALVGHHDSKVSPPLLTTRKGMPMSQGTRPPDRPVWLAIMTIVAVLIASGTAELFHLAHATTTSTLTAAGAAFMAAMTLFVTIWNFLLPPR